MIFRSPLPDLEIPNTPLTSFVFDRVRELGAKAALTDGPTGRTLSFEELFSAIRRMAKGLSDWGFQKGDVLAIYAPNSPEYAVAFHGAASIGGISTTVNPLYTAQELGKQLTDSGARLLIVAPACVEKALEAVQGTKVEEIFVLGEAPSATPFSALLDNDGDPPEVEIDPAQDLVALPYSSGTTGLQKGVMLTHRNLVANLVQTDAAFENGITENDVCVGILPFFHIYGMLVVMNLALWRGASAIVLPRFELEGFLDAMARYRVTVANLVPPIVLALAKHPLVENFDLSALQWIMSGAAPLSKELSEACARRLDCYVFQGYGLTETSPVSHCSPIVPERIKYGSVGPPVPNTECKVVSPETGDELGYGEDGEIWIRGPQVMKGYLGNPEATAACMDADGFFHSGDIGRVDEDGYFYIVDRLKELIKYKGLQIAPAELEALLLTHPAIQDVAVVPAPDDRAGEVPKAFVVLKGELSKEAIMEFVAERVAPYKKIRIVEIVDKIPKSPSGKILRRLLR